MMDWVRRKTRRTVKKLRMSEEWGEKAREMGSDLEC